VTERIPQLLDLQRGAAYLARQQAVIAWAHESLANIRALVADLPRVATALNVRGDNAAYDALVRANERVRRAVAQVQADGWRPWVVYALYEQLMHDAVGPEVPDSVIALTNEWLAAWYALDEARDEADGLLGEAAA